MFKTRKKSESDFEVSLHPHFLTAAIRGFVNGQERDPSLWRSTHIIFVFSSGAALFADLN